jgi:hypothetical protein
MSSGICYVVHSRSKRRFYYSNTDDDYMCTHLHNCVLKKVCTYTTMAAGLLFTNEKLFLAGYKSFKGHVTGIGGKPSDGDMSQVYTAFRETIEELLGIKDVDNRVICKLMGVVVPYKEVTNSGYTHYFCTFEDLSVFLTVASLSVRKSPYYDIFPTTIDQLLFERKNTERAEIAQLCLLPYVQEMRIARHLINDINLCAMPVSTK